MRGSLVLVLLLAHLLITVQAQQDRPERREFEIALRNPSVEVDSIDIEWLFVGDNEIIEQAFISATYTGPCPGVRLPPKDVVLNFPSSEMYTITGLQEFSSYRVNVTLFADSGIGRSIGMFTTKGGAPSSLITLRLQSVTMTSLTISWTPIPCLDLNSRLEEYITILTPLNSLQGRTLSGIPSTSTSHTFTGLMPGSLYMVELNATYSISDFSGLIRTEIAIPINASTFAIPGPLNLSVVDINTTTITVSWQQEQPIDGLAGYQVMAQYVGPCSSGIRTRLEATILISNRMYMFEDLAEFGLYDIIITSLSTTNQNASARINVQTLPSAPHASPSSLRVLNLAAFSLTLTWNAIECPQRRSEISSYVVYFAPSALYNDTTRSSISNITNTMVNITDLIDSTPYSLQVQAVNREGILSPISQILEFNTSSPPPPPENLRVMSTQANSATLIWVPLEAEFGYTIMITYLGPCTDAQISPWTSAVQGGRVVVPGLEEFSNYVAMVTPQGGRVASMVAFTTSAADPTPADDHVQHVSSTNTSIVLQAPPISCIDENGHISEFRLRYAQTEDFGRGENVRNGIFSPGLVIVGNLEPGTRYTFQLRILTQQGGSVILDPLTTSTTGDPAVTTPPTDAPTLSAAPGDDSDTDAIIITVVLVVGISGLIALTALVLVCLTWKRCSYGARRSDAQRLISEEPKLGIGVQFSDLETFEGNPFARNTAASVNVKDEWARALRPTSDLEFNQIEWMIGLGENPTAAVYQEGDNDFDENMFEK